jgi:diadenosine tetraphosphate (Ap4A) HIT family hydrolase
MDNCIFCKIIAREAIASIVFEDELCLVFMDIKPVTPGHVLVVPKQHVVGLSDLHGEIGGHLFQVGQNMASAIKQSKIPCEGVNFFLADGEIAGQTVFHVHLHVIPRTSGDGFRLYYGPDYNNLPKREVLNQLAKDVSSCI